MTRRNPPARYTLPEVVNPSGVRCFMVPVPDDFYHVAAFKGAIFSLTKPYAWAEDDDHTGKDVAAVWRAIFLGLEACVPAVQFRQVVACLLEYSTDGGVTWDVAFDASTCANEVIQERIEDGTLSAGGQAPGQGSGTPGQCYTYQVTLQGSGRWISPVALDAGDVITVANVQGAWWSGELLEPWACGNGDIYTLGECTGVSLGTSPGDPLNTLAHMRLIGYLPDEAAPYFDMFNTAYTVVNGPQDLILQANDAPLDDNDGSITFTVEICKGLWCIGYDFTASDQSWFLAAHAGEPGCLGSYHAGVGWVGDCQPGGTFQRISIGYGLDLTGTTVTQMDIDIDLPSSVSTSSLYVRIFGTVVRDVGSYGALPAGPQTITITGLALTADDIQWVTVDTGAGVPATITAIRFRGTGIRPSEPAC